MDGCFPLTLTLSPNEGEGIRLLGFGDGLRAGDAAGKGEGRRFALVEGLGGLDVAAKVVESCAELERGAKEEFGAHCFELVSIKGALDASQERGKLFELFLEGGDVSLLKFLDVEGLEDVNGSAGRGLRFPVEEGGFGDTKFFGDGTEAPAIGAHEEKGVFGFGRVHNLSFYWKSTRGGRTSTGGGAIKIKIKDQDQETRGSPLAGRGKAPVFDREPMLRRADYEQV